MKKYISEINTLEKISFSTSIIIILMVVYDIVMTTYFHRIGIESQTLALHMAALIILCGLSTIFGFINILLVENKKS